MMGKVVELLSSKDTPKGSVLDVNVQEYTADWLSISHFDCTTTATNTFTMS